jgi:hypothetical protein
MPLNDYCTRDRRHTFLVQLTTPPRAARGGSSMVENLTDGLNTVHTS